MSFSTFSYNQRNHPAMPKRTQESNKGTYGRVACICGSVGMAGAAYLCGKAVLRMGAGLVEIITPEENRIILQTLLPEAIICTYDRANIDFDKIDKSLCRADAVVCGCGLGTGRESLALVSHLLRTCTLPCVLDADALNLLSQSPSLLKYAKGKIITPHPGEMSRLCGQSIDEICSDTPAVCQAFAQRFSLVCALKVHRTAISDGGERVCINTTGNSGMATAGSGDVLAGIIGGILAQNKSSSLTLFEAAALGVYIHGSAGDIAARKTGEYSMMASDILDAIPCFFTREGQIKAI